MVYKFIEMKYFLFGLITLFSLSCQTDHGDSDSVELRPDEVGPVGLYGNTQGTTFAVISNDPIRLTMSDVTTILRNFDEALSTYIDSSVITRLNNAGVGSFSYQDPYHYFNRCYWLSQTVYQATNGCFDPSVYPLVDGWGFMKDIEIVPDSVVVDSLRLLLGFQNGHHFTFKAGLDQNGDSLQNAAIFKNTPGAKLDFNAIAQGLAVDVLAEELERLGSANYYVEIGGELRVKGKNADGEIWRIGIDQPIEASNAENRKIQEVVELDNRSIATSGSYRKFYEKDGIRYSHTLDPKTGYPVTHSLLSATVIAETCAMADAYATAFMVMGPEKSIAFIKENPQLNLEIYLIFINEFDAYETYYTKGFGDRILI